MFVIIFKKSTKICDDINFNMYEFVIKCTYITLVPVKKGLGDNYTLHQRQAHHFTS